MHGVGPNETEMIFYCFVCSTILSDFKEIWRQIIKDAILFYFFCASRETCQLTWPSVYLAELFGLSSDT